MPNTAALWAASLLGFEGNLQWKAGPPGPNSAWDMSLQKSFISCSGNADSKKAWCGLCGEGRAWCRLCGEDLVPAVPGLGG